MRDGPNKQAPKDHEGLLKLAGMADWESNHSVTHMCQLFHTAPGFAATLVYSTV